MPTNSPWVPQEDGTYQPSADLLNKVRANPEQYPNAVEDFATMSGKSQEDVKGILANPNDRSWWNNFENIGDFVEGAQRGVSTATRKLGSVIGSETLENAGTQMGEFVEQMDPKFSTEKGIVENLTEVAGQAAPMMGAAAGAAASAPLAGLGAVVAGGVVGHLTFEDDDNLIELMDDYADGSVPDFLIIQPEDDEGTSQMKSLANNLITEAATAGLFHVVGRLYKAVKAGDPEAFAKAAQEAAEEGVTVADDLTPQGTARPAVEAAEGVGEVLSKEKPIGAKDTQDVIKKEAEALNEASLAKAETRAATVDHTPDSVDHHLFVDQSLTSLKHTLRRTKATNTGLRDEVDEFINGGEMAGTRAWVSDIYKAVSEDNLDEAIRLLKDTSRVDAKYYAMVADATQRATLDRVFARYQSVVKAIRENPEVMTRTAYREVANKVSAAKLEIGEMNRALGSGASYQLLNRQGSLDLIPDKELQKAIEANSKELQDALRKDGYTLLSDKDEFMHAVLEMYEKGGYDSRKLIKYTEEMFDEFDKMRQGAVSAMSTNRMSKLSEAEKAALEGSFTKLIHDLHSSALLGQLSTTGLEATSNALQNALLPIYNIIGAKSWRAAGSGTKRALREYVGYRAGFTQMWDVAKRTWVTGRGVVDDMDVMDAAHAHRADYLRLWAEGKYGKYVALRLWKGASDISMATSESFKAMRGFGVAYADGLDAALLTGVGKKEAKALALKHASSKFDASGRIVDPMLQLNVARTSWQSKIDSRYYLTGKLAQGVENARNSNNPVMSTMSRAVVPFFRTLVNIGGDAAQAVVPGPIIRGLSKIPATDKYIVGAARFLDDFTGRNGEIALMQATARQRLGAVIIGAAGSAIIAGKVKVTPPGGFQSWDAKMAQWETEPGSSLIIGDTAIDLTRLLPFSAPILYAGILAHEDQIAETELRDGALNGDLDWYDVATVGTNAYGLMMYSMMSDVGAMRGVGEFAEAFFKAVEGDMSGIGRFTQDYAKQFTPGLIRMYGKTANADQFIGEDFLSKMAASAGYGSFMGKEGTYQRLDFLGKPVRDFGRGLDPLNVRPVKTNSDELYKEYANLSRSAEMGLRLANPSGIFDASFWEAQGVDTTGMPVLGNTFGKSVPSLNKLKLANGQNAYDKYRSLVYNGKASEDITKSTSSVGDRVGVGSIQIRKGENLEAALRRYVNSPVYANMNPDAREKVWKTIFGVFKKNAKDYVKANTIVTPDVYENSRYGSPIQGPATIADAQAGAKVLAKQVQTTVGNPNVLEERFKIKP